MSPRFVLPLALAFMGNIFLQASHARASTSVTEAETSRQETQGKSMLFDFTTCSTLDHWVEQSDNVRTVGMSKAVIALQKTQVFQRAIFFTLLNPQPNGAGFAGVRTFKNFDLHDYTSIRLLARAQGNNTGYKIVLRHKNQNEEPHPTYEQMFDVRKGEFYEIDLPLSDFKPYYRGRELNATEAEPLDTSRITSFGLQVYGGVYLPVKQSGPATLEIDWIAASADSPL